MLASENNGGLVGVGLQVCRRPAVQKPAITSTDGPTTEQVIDQFVPDPKVAEEFGTTLMGLWRWDRDEKLRELGWKPPVKIRGRNHRVRRFPRAVQTGAHSPSVREAGRTDS